MADSIVHREQGRELSLREAMNRLFEESWLRSSGLGSPRPESLALDMYQTEDALVVQVALPGLKPEDFDVSIAGDTLTIKGEYKHEEGIEQGQYIYRERRAGQFCRQVALPVAVNADESQAEYEQGMLTLRLPKAKPAKPKGIAIRAK